MHATQQRTAPGYIISEVDVADAAAYQTYAKQVPETLAPFGGHFLVRGGRASAVEGEAPKRIVVIAFDSYDKAQAWEDSPAYGVIKSIRHNAAKSRVIVAEGVVGK
jgi:uncharacterized protein (DUF1330 family)